MQQYSTTNVEGQTGTVTLFYSQFSETLTTKLVALLSEVLMQPHWHIAFINQCFKGSSCFGLAFSSFYVTKDKTLEGNISIYSMVLRLRDFAVPQGGYCLQTALKCFRQYFYPKEFKEECFWFAALKTCFERRMLKCNGPGK